MSFKYERFLIQAIEQLQLPRIMSCIKRGYNIHAENNLGQNLLVHLLKQTPPSRDPFFEKKRLQIFQFLITQCNLPIHNFDHYGKNLFNWAANLNCTHEAIYLLQTYPGDVDILIRDQSGLCSLHYAIEHGNEILVHAIVDYLLQYRIRFDIQDNHQNTPEELAKKLGYEHIADYLAETCRATIFMSRKPTFFQYRPSTNKSKATVLTSGLSVSSSSISDVSEFHQLIESKIETAKNGNDWKTVASLRRYQTNPTGKKLHQFRKFILGVEKYFSFIKSDVSFFRHSSSSSTKNLEHAFTSSFQTCSDQNQFSIRRIISRHVTLTRTSNMFILSSTIRSLLRTTRSSYCERRPSNSHGTKNVRCLIASYVIGLRRS